MEQQGAVAVITGFVPVSETIGFSAEMRAATSGSAFWQSTFDHWAPVPDSLLMDVIKKIRTKKGMTPEPPTAAEFIVRE